MEPFSLIALILYATLFGACMKIADLLDEHGLKWFPGDKLLFGILWGLFGILLIWSRQDIANIFLARILVYIPRKRLDYFNHALAAVMIIVTFLWKTTLTPGYFHPLLFIIFFGIFFIFGTLRDYQGNKENKKNALFVINEFALYHIIATLVYSIIIKDFTPFLVATTAQLSYNLIKYSFYMKGWTQEL